MHIYLHTNKSEENFLKKKTQEVDVSAFKKGELRELVRAMRKIMKETNGVGLSANQIGLSHRMFVAETPDAQHGTKLYAILNPKIIRQSSEEETLEEGCLSIPNKYGLLKRSARVTLTGIDINNKPLKIKAWGLLARIFQHETDHLDGKLISDRAKEMYASPTSERLHAREEKINTEISRNK